jgi:hypothetical protein
MECIAKRSDSTSASSFLRQSFANVCACVGGGENCQKLLQQMGRLTTGASALRFVIELLVWGGQEYFAGLKNRPLIQTANYLFQTSYQIKMELIHSKGTWPRIRAFANTFLQSKKFAESCSDKLCDICILRNGHVVETSRFL